MTRITLPSHFAAGAPLPTAPPPALTEDEQFDLLVNGPPPAAPTINNVPAPSLLQLTAQQTLALRTLARRNYRDFLKYWVIATRQNLRWGWFHDYIADVMQSVYLRQRRRVIVNIPPRHLKSTLISQMWHAWMIGMDDTANSALLSTAATAMLAARDSRKTIDVLRSDWYKSLFPHVELNRENEVEWETKGGAYRIAVGRGGTVTGRGGDHITVDDLLLSDEANSETIREKCNEWMGETLASRLNNPKTGTITVIMQRFHERDVTGYLLAQSKTFGADQYEHIVLPMEAPKRTTIILDGEIRHIREAGELLDPGRIGPDEVLALKAKMRANYDGQYQQNPVKMAGGLLDPSRLIRIESTGADIVHRFGLRLNAYIDFATKEKQTNKDDPDYSVVAVMGRDQMGRIFIVDIFRKQTAYDGLARTICSMQRIYNFRAVKGEKGGLINTFQPILTMTQRMMGVFFALWPFKGQGSQGDKVAKSSTFQGLLNAGLVAVPANAPWLPDLEAEMRSFPNGSHDDQIDAISMGCNDSLDIMEGEAPVTHPSDPKIVFDQQIKEELQRRIDAERSGEAEGCTDGHDW